MVWTPPLIHPVGDCTDPMPISTVPAGPNPPPEPEEPPPTDPPAVPTCP